MRTAIGIVFVVGLLTIGCWRQAGPANARPPASSSETEPEKKAWRDLDEAAGKELAQAWKDNPNAAMEKYEASRFRLKVKVFSIGIISAETASRVKGVESDRVVMRERELNRLVNGKEFVLEFRVTRYIPGLTDGVKFDDGVVVSGPE